MTWISETGDASESTTEPDAVPMIMHDWCSDDFNLSGSQCSSPTKPKLEDLFGEYLLEKDLSFSDDDNALADLISDPRGIEVDKENSDDDLDICVDPCWSDEEAESQTLDNDDDRVLGLDSDLELEQDHNSGEKSPVDTFSPIRERDALIDPLEAKGGTEVLAGVAEEEKTRYNSALCSMLSVFVTLHNGIAG